MSPMLVKQASLFVVAVFAALLVGHGYPTWVVSSPQPTELQFVAPPQVPHPSVTWDHLRQSIARLKGGGLTKGRGVKMMSSTAEGPVIDTWEADRLMSGDRSTEQLKRAYEIYSAYHDLYPDDARITLKTAQALVALLRAETAQLTMATVKGRGKMPAATHQFVKSHGQTALQLIAGVKDDLRDDPEAQFLYAEALLFAMSAESVSSMLKQKLPQKLSSQLQLLEKRFPTFSDGYAFVWKGLYYFEAPWPMRSMEKAQRCLQQAVKIAPDSKSVNYYMGLISYAMQDRDTAAQYFGKALSCKWHTISEKDAGSAIDSAAKLGLQYAAGGPLV